MKTETNAQRTLKSLSSILREKELQFFNKGFEGMDGKPLKELRAHSNKLRDEWLLEKNKIISDFTKKLEMKRKF